jgi:hypothetical protein
MNVATIYIRNAPMTFPTYTSPNDLALLAGDWVRQFMLSPPFAWRWNRTVTSFNTIAGQQDYPEVLSTFGWIEKANLVDNTQAPAVAVELQTRLNLSLETQTSQPVSVSPYLDNNDGTITFRLFPVPDKIYTVTINSQNAAPTFVSLNDLWTPIPDYLSYVYQQGFLAKAYEYFADERFSEAMQLFIKQTIAANTGLDETEVNLFLGERLITTRQAASMQQNIQLGNQGRAL